MKWILVSLVLSVVLTIALNAGVRAFPNAPRRIERRIERVEPGVRVYFPWKAMLIGSILLTVVLNILLRL